MGDIILIDHYLGVDSMKYCAPMEATFSTGDCELNNHTDSWHLCVKFDELHIYLEKVLEREN